MDSGSQMDSVRWTGVVKWMQVVKWTQVVKWMCSDLLTRYGKKLRCPNIHRKQYTVFDLITAYTPIRAQSSNAVVFRLQPVYFLSTSL